MPPGAAIFDMDGLLINSERIARSTFIHTCEQHGLGDQSEFYYEILGTNNDTTRIQLHNAFSHASDPAKLFEEWMQLYLQQTASAVPLMRGVESLLQTLQQCGIAMAVATSSDTAVARSKLGNAGILHYFKHLTGGDQVDSGKPAPDIYLKSARKLAVDPAQCVALEDSPNGVRAAVAAGMQVIQVPDLLQPTDELLALGHMVMAHLDEAEMWFRKKLN